MIIKAIDLTKKYENKLIFKNLNFEIEENKITCILGHSGSGKSTILNLISGIEPFDSGEIKIANKLKKSFVFQEHRLLDWKTVRENIAFIKEKKDVNNAELDNILKDVELLEYDNFYPSQLSGGMKQRVSIARAFYYDANLMLMDEPFNSLDLKLKYDILTKLVRLWERRKISIIFITHDIDEALLIGDKIIVLNGDPTEVEKTFLIDAPQIKRKLTDDNLETIREEILKILLESYK